MHIRPSYDHESAFSSVNRYTYSNYVIHSETGYSEGDSADTFLRYIEGFVISGLHCISNYGNVHC